MLSPAFYLLNRVASFIYFALGSTLLIVPNWAGARFPWTIGEFTSATWGMWWIAAGIYALYIDRVKLVAKISPCLVHLWMFALLELVVIGYFNNDFRISRPLAVPYLVALLAGMITALMGVADIVQKRPSFNDGGPRLPMSLRIVTAIATLGIIWLGFKSLTLSIGNYGSEGNVFPDRLSAPSARTFGAFYLAVGLSGVPLVVARTISPVLTLARVGMALSVLIVLVSLIHIQKFDFAKHPGGLYYIGAYVITAVAAAILLVMVRIFRSTGASPVPK
jgi:hypothetical protein